MTQARLSVIDFFCGGGGFSEGFRMAGYDIVKGIDNWQPAIETHNINHGLNDPVQNILDFESIVEINKLPETEIIIGSPPCVLFSLSNHGGNANKDLGLKLIKSFFRVIAVKKHQKHSILKAWLMENVPNSRNYVKKQYTFSDLDLEKWARNEGFSPNDIAIKVKDNGEILCSSDYGAGQTRKRFVCGEIVKTGVFPSPQKSRFDQPKPLTELFSRFPKPLVSKQIGYVNDPNYENIKIKANDLHDHFYDTGVYEVEWKKARQAKWHHPYMGRMSFPENIDKPSRTIMATMSASTREAILYESEYKRKNNGQYRTPTIREAAIIMGFPITYQFYGDESVKWRQVGNAVCVQLSLALANSIKEKLNIVLPKPKNMVKNTASLTFLDDNNVKQFNKPPIRNPKALFRMYTLKSNNMTVDFTNRNEQSVPCWQIVAHSGTGKDYRTVVVTKKHFIEAKRILTKECPEFIKDITKDKDIRIYSKEELDVKNKEYGLTSKDKQHPYHIINKITQRIQNNINGEDKIIDTKKGLFCKLKSNIPISQIMSVYALGILLFGK